MAGHLIASLIVLVYVTIGFGSTSAVARDLEVGRTGPVLVLNGSVTAETARAHVDYLFDDDWTLTPADALRPEAQFAPLRSKTAEFSYTRSRVWLRARVRNATRDRSEWRLFFAENFKQVFDIYVAREGRLETVLSLDRTSSFAARPIPYPELVAPLRLEPGESATVLVSLWSEGSSYIDMSILTAEDFALSASTRTAKNFLFYGMIALLIVTALTCLLIFRNPIFAAYSGYSLSALLYLMHSDGVAFQYLWPNAPGFNSMASVYLGGGIIIFGAIYSRMFLRTAQLHPWIDRLLLAIIAWTLGAGAILFFLDAQLLKKLLIVTSLVAIVTFTVAGIVAAFSRFREVRFYLFAWTGAVVAATLLNLNNLFGFGLGQDFVFDAMRGVMVFDAAMMGLAVADRYAQLRSSQQAALRARLDDARRSIQTNRRLHELEERYAIAAGLADARGAQLRDTVHDLQQPLHALRRNVGRLSGDRRLDVEEREGLEAAFAYLENLVSETLDAAVATTPAKRAAGQDERSIALSAVIASVHGMFEQDAAERNIALSVRDGQIAMPVDGFTIMRILSNLVSNAIKYGGDEVSVSAERVESGIVLAVQDSGPGMTPSDFAEATGVEVRLADDAGDEGHGLGLAIVKELCRQNGFELALAETNTGTRIEVTLPDRAMPAPTT